MIRVPFPLVAVIDLAYTARMAAKQSSSPKFVVYAALAGNFAIAVVKFIAASITGSSSMQSEGVHSLVDSINQVLLLYGINRSQKPANANHPFGYGRELYFWAFIVALLVLAFGAGVSIYEGIQHIREPAAMEKPLVNYMVLGISAVFEGASWWVSMRSFRQQKGTMGWFEAFRQSKDPTTFTVLFEDSAALIGLALAALGTTASYYLNMPVMDGVASICIGLVLALSATLMARESKNLLLGETASKTLSTDIMRVAASQPGIQHVNGVLTEQLGPQQVLVLLSAEFRDDLTSNQIEECVNQLENTLRALHSDIEVLFVKPQTQQVWLQRIAARQRPRSD